VLAHRRLAADDVADEVSVADCDQRQCGNGVAGIDQPVDESDLDGSCERSFGPPEGFRVNPADGLAVGGLLPSNEHGTS
jgi:hypothetical protein